MFHPTAWPEHPSKVMKIPWTVKPVNMKASKSFIYIYMIITMIIYNPCIMDQHLRTLTASTTPIDQTLWDLQQLQLCQSLLHLSGRPVRYLPGLLRSVQGTESQCHGWWSNGATRAPPAEASNGALETGGSSGGVFVERWTREATSPGICRKWANHPKVHDEIKWVDF